jgi:cysteinyl-tRNA synthetase
MFLISYGLAESEKLTYKPGSYIVFGNDGKHLNKAVNKPENKIVSKEIADALHKASDHLPVVIELEPPGMDSRLSNVKDFLYILQTENVNISTLANSEFDLIVMDYAKFGDADSEYNRNQIEKIKTGGRSNHSKVVLAYMSIGEAEDYRFYWHPSWEPGLPPWLGPTNPEWEGNYKVRYWMQGWKNIIFGTPSGSNKSYLDRIIDQGFDGVYLDIIDAYEYWSGPEGGYERTRIQARRDMVNFVREIKDYARNSRGTPDFLIFPQNGADIIYADDEMLDALGREYLGLCDGLGQEDTWYMEDEPQKPSDSLWLTQILDIYKANATLILSVDYIWDAQNPDSLDNKARFNDFYTNAYEKGYIPYAADKNRELNDLVIIHKGNGFDFDQPHPDYGNNVKFFYYR